MSTSKKVSTKKEPKNYFLLHSDVLYSSTPFTLEELRTELKELLDEGNHSPFNMEEKFAVIDCISCKVKSITLSMGIKLV